MSSKRALVHELIDEVRRSQSATQAVDDAVADLMGVNHTDFRCLDIIQRRGRTTAGAPARREAMAGVGIALVAAGVWI